ncbi:zinc finger protein 518B [Mesocricetus auratus]|uniref:Zinc finger protein 518B n=1 Tax=Mesocricetus auratus TaxID=10036 RepID=A0A1U7Q9M9_MESAU|nr:zinc finger protein 518B [Mesocricetus auratus]XP_012968005.1 zinc finger protein 518B [Mesocricetus auratus]XP_040602954.1 zinc finger protein 518B [Mesocricetus auratus]
MTSSISAGYVGMQLKMKDIGEQLYTTQVNGGPSSLTMSPKQPNCSRATRPDRQEAQTLLYQGSEAEAATMTIATCVQCKSVHKIPPQDLRKGPGQSQKEDAYVCFKCSLRTVPAQLHFVNSNSSAVHVRNETEAISSPVNNKFKVRNFKPGKYYCDKCRFSTKDPLQYRKHTMQHEEIKFICSHCSYISYTKGEFQRHLVKHTGIFPYRCEYCEYGAIRNDYIVKHRRRVHERAGAKRPLKTVAKLEPKRATNISKQSMELSKAPSPRATFQNKLSDQLSRFSLHTNKDKTHSLMLLPELKKYQKDVVCIPNKMALSESSEVSLLGHKNVEVEVLSPSKEPVQPGMPLTVVAPSELVVPTNCLAQLIDVKVVNGTQQLVLKLFPLEENSRLETGREDGSTSECTTTEKGSGGQKKRLSPEAARSLATEGNTAEFVGIDHLHSLVQKQLKNVKWVKSCNFLMPNSGVHSHQESFLGSDTVKDLQKTHSLCPPRALPSVALKGHSPASVQSSVSCGPGTTVNPFLSKSAISFAEDGRGSRSDSQQLLPLASLPAKVSFSGEKGLLPIGENDLEARNRISCPETIVSTDRKLEDKRIENKAVGNTGQLSSAQKNEYLHKSLTGKEKLRSQQPGDQPVQPKNSDKTGNTFEGPVISSVFSLSSGSENVPEGIKWNSSTTKIKSIELLRRKIAQLIESCGKPSSLSANGAQRRSIGQASKLTSKATPKGIQEMSASLSGPGPSSGPSIGPPPKPQNESSVTSNGQLAQQQVCPKFVNADDGNMESRVTRKTPVATPVLIPKGAVLRVLNSSEDAHIIEATYDTPVSIPCSETQLAEPLPFCPMEQTGSGSQPLTCRRGPADMSPNLETSLRPKSKREDSVCSTTLKKIIPVYSTQLGNNDSSRPGRPISRNLTISKNKTKQVNSAKKKSKMQADPIRSFKDPSFFQVARQLRLIAAKPDQLIKCPRRNQPVIVLNHPDVDSPEVTNVMKVINKYKGNVLKVVLSERTRCQLGIRRHHMRLTYQNSEEANHMKRQMMLKMKLKKVHKNNYQVVGSLPEDPAQCVFKCWFCGRLYEDQEEWMSHGQRHLIEATRDWDVLSSKGK